MNAICPTCHGPMGERLNGYCRTCYNAYQRAYMQLWRKRHPDWVRLYSKRRTLRRAYRKVFLV